MPNIAGMKISVDTKEDSHEDIRKVISMLRNLVGDSQEIFTNQPQSQESASPMANIFGDVSAPSEAASPETAQGTLQEAQSQETEETETSESTEDLFAELFSEEELKKMDEAKVKKDDEEEIKPAKSKKYGIEFY